MRLATFNVLHGKSLSDGRVDVDRFAAAVASLDADVLGLQEVDREQPRSGGADLTAVAAEATGAVAWRFAPALLGTPGHTWSAAENGAVATGPAYGVALVSRLPVREWRVVPLPPARTVTPVVLSSGRTGSVLDAEPRVALIGVVKAASGPMTIASTHLSFVPGWNALQLRRVTDAMRDLPEPQVVLGDLNTPGPFPRALSAWRPLARARTFPRRKPLVQLDHALACGPLPAVTAAAAVALPLSDHRALVVDLAGESARGAPTGRP